MKLRTLLSLSALILTSTAITTSGDKQIRLTRRPDFENDPKVVRYEKKCGLTSTTVEIINLANDLNSYQTDVFIYKVSDFYPGFTSLDLINEDSGFDCFEASSMFENEIQDNKKLVYCKVTCHAHGDIDDQYQEIVDISEKTFIRYFKDARHPEQGNQNISVDVNEDFGYYCALLKHTERSKDTNNYTRLFKVTKNSTPIVKILTEGSDDFRKFHIMMIPVFLTLVCLIAGCYHLLINARIRWNILAAVILYLFNVSFKLFFGKISYRIYYEKAWKVDWFTYSVCDLITLTISIAINLALDSGLIYLLCVNVFENVFNDEISKSVGTLGILFAFVMLRFSLASCGGFPVFEKSPPLLFNFQSEIPAGFWYNFVFYAIFVTFILSISIGRLFQEFYDISYFTLKQNQSMPKKISMLKCIFLLSLLVSYFFLFESLHFSTHNDHKLWTLNAVESYLEKTGGLRYCFMALQGYVLTILGFIGCIAADVLESEAK
ncbi:hypothetical protein WICPIJ_004144 [Wickerhamomyces pijperi]|uniref:Uncharacterized protein n=1 Tax=Wickerhamomyces pijperi TaxID=599730 RepID=A0A9P8Q895_WICPI|nr:hypothetical protein WICPIJ_004144 [Wickerhamomyces pijperi]